MTLIELAIKYRAIIEKAMQNLDDKEASEALQLHRGLNEDGALVPAGTRINWNGQIKKATVDLWDRAEQNPDNAPTLWTDIDYIDGVRKIPETDSGIFSAALAFALGEEGYSTIDDLVYISQVAGNAYTPQLVPTNWKVKE